jgi:sigma-E factor negative regulatory protein RseC
MIEQTATVLATADGVALVEVPRQSACGACGQGAACGTSVIAKLFSASRSTRLQIADGIGLEPGEQIVIGIRDSVLAGASVVAYLLPLLAFIGTAGAAAALGLGDLGSAAVGIAGLLAGLWITGRITGGTGGTTRYRPVLVRRLGGARPIRFDPMQPASGG